MATKKKTIKKKAPPRMAAAVKKKSPVFRGDLKRPPKRPPASGAVARPVEVELSAAQERNRIAQLAEANRRRAAKKKAAKKKVAKKKVARTAPRPVAKKTPKRVAKKRSAKKTPKRAAGSRMIMGPGRTVEISCPPCPTGYRYDDDGGLVPYSAAAVNASKAAARQAKERAKRREDRRCSTAGAKLVDCREGPKRGSRAVDCSIAGSELVSCRPERRAKRVAKQDKRRQQKQIRMSGGVTVKIR